MSDTHGNTFDDAPGTSDPGPDTPAEVGKRERAPAPATKGGSVDQTDAPKRRHATHG